jgi:hypothetical protein
METCSNRQTHFFMHLLHFSQCRVRGYLSWRSDTAGPSFSRVLWSVWTWNVRWSGHDFGIILDKACSGGTADCGDGSHECWCGNIYAVGRFERSRSYVRKLHHWYVKENRRNVEQIFISDYSRCFHQRYYNRIRRRYTIYGCGKDCCCFLRHLRHSCGGRAYGTSEGAIGRGMLCFYACTKEESFHQQSTAESHPNR